MSSLEKEKFPATDGIGGNSREYRLKYSRNRCLKKLEVTKWQRTE